MSVEGLKAILAKEPVVGTQAAETICQNPQVVEDAYLRHVRSFVPLGRVAQGHDDTLTVAAFERRVIELVKKGAAPTGYVTADYGYGKTSTCLYLWERCTAANLLAVPPFQLVALPDLLAVTHAWVRYCIARRVPALVGKADEIQARYVAQSVAAMAGGDAGRLAILQDLRARGQLLLDLPGIRYVGFLEEMTALALEAGFDGLVVIADEIQQYLDPAIKGGSADPTAALFDIVQGMITRQGTLRCGLILSIPRVSLTVLNDRRGDLVQRLKAHGLGFDLLTVYGPGFATELWEHLTRAFDCQEEATRVLGPDTLDALGQIAARPELANGPRTVVSAFSALIARHFAQGGEPATPFDLVDAFLSGAIAFDGSSTLQTVINRCLATPLVSERAERGRAIRLLAAFPTFGCTRGVLERYGLQETADELASGGQGQVVLYLGGGIDREGRQLGIGITLVGLEPSSGADTGWLTTTLKDFWRVYGEGDAHTYGRALSGFTFLLQERVVPRTQFTLQEIMEQRFTQDAGLVLEGSFPGTARTYPRRRLHLRILLNEEEARGPDEGDLSITFRLRANLGQPEEARWADPGVVTLGDSGGSTIALNLSHRTSEAVFADLQKLQPVINPFKLTPLFMLALYGYLEEKRAAGAVPQDDDQLLKNTFQASLLDRCMAELFNADLGAALQKAGAAIVEEVFRRQCVARYPRYATFMAGAQWSAASREYLRALAALPSTLDRRGDQPFRSTKEDLARLLGRTASTLDTFISTYPRLIEIVQPFGNRAQNFEGEVRFTLHPLEREFMAALEASPEVADLQSGRQLERVPRMERAALARIGQVAGYRDEEIKLALELLEARDLVLLRDHTVLKRPVSIDLDGLRHDLAGAQEALRILLAHYSSDSTLRQNSEQFEKLRGIIDAPGFKADDTVLIRIANDIKARERLTQNVMADRLAELRARIEALTIPASLEPSRLQRLNPAVAHQFFGLQLDGLRALLLREAQQLGQKSADIGTHYRQLLASSRATEVGAKELVELARQADQLGKGAAATVAERASFDGRFNGYERCDDALDTTRIVAGVLEGAGEDGTALRAELEGLVRAINGALSSEKLAALGQGSNWAMSLRQFRQRVDAALAQGERRFAQMQGRYRAGLGSVGIPAERLPAPTPFDRGDPQGSLEKLHDDVRVALSRLVEGLPSRIEGHTSLLDQQAARIEKLDAEGVWTIERRMGEIRETLPAAYREAVALAGQAGDPAVIGDYPDDGGGAFGSLLRRFKELISTIGTQRAGIKTVTEEIDALKKGPTPEEKAVLDAIRAEGKESVDMGTLLQGRTPAEALKALGGLYLAGRVLIRVSIPAGR